MRISFLATGNPLTSGSIGSFGNSEGNINGRKHTQRHTHTQTHTHTHRICI